MFLPPVVINAICADIPQRMRQSRAAEGTRAVGEFLRNLTSPPNVRTFRLSQARFRDRTRASAHARSGSARLGWCSGRRRSQDTALRVKRRAPYDLAHVPDLRDARGRARIRRERVARLREVMARAGVDAVLVPHADEYMNEYVPPCGQRLAWLTGFTGSAGLAVVARKAAALFVDGRYILQAPKQVDTEHLRSPADPGGQALATGSARRSRPAPWSASIPGCMRRPPWTSWRRSWQASASS